jgi:hypothetical protein
LGNIFSQNHLVALFSTDLCHSPDDVRVLHGRLHVRSDAPAATCGADEELHQGEQGGVAVLLVAVDPIVDDRLRIRGEN